MTISKNGRKGKDERFLDVASKRTENVLKAIRLLKKCSNKKSYSYDKAQVNKIFKTINSELSDCKSAFLGNRSKKEFRL